LERFLQGLSLQSNIEVSELSGDKDTFRIIWIQGYRGKQEYKDTGI